MYSDHKKGETDHEKNILIAIAVFVLAAAGSAVVFSRMNGSKSENGEFTKNQTEAVEAFEKTSAESSGESSKPDDVGSTADTSVTTERASETQTEAKSTENVTAATTSAPASEKSNESDWVTAYKNFLKNYDLGTLKNDFRFKLFYLTGDDIPEIAIAAGEYFAAQCEIYTYYDGRVCDIGTFGNYGGVSYVERQSLIVNYFAHAPEEHNTVYKVSGGEANMIFSASSNSISGMPPEQIWYKVNGEDVDEETYKRLEAENLPETKSCCPVYDGYQFTDYNIENVIG